MSSYDEMPEWAAAAGQPVGDYENTLRRRRGRQLLLGLLALSTLGATAFGGYLAAGFLDGESTETTAAPDAPTTVDGADDEVDDSDENNADENNAVATDNEPSSDEDGDGSDGPSDTADSPGADEDRSGDETVEPLTAEGTTMPSSAPETDDEPESTSESEASARTASLRQGKLYLGGAVPSEEVAEAIVTKAAAVVGPDNVEANFDIDPDVAFDPGQSTPLVVEDVVLFQFNSVAIDPPFVPILDLGVLLLSQNPQASITVITRTDATGSEEINLEVATKRASAVLAYWVSKGVNPDQVRLDPRGEEGSSDNDDAETAATQRRAEFIVTNILG